ncbi:MAG TPA: MarR family transcriptional regulator [Hyphomicrobiales bacterium]|nr:MarR family transcriptional regulator [Hyphomicrobiales bacterium]
MVYDYRKSATYRLTQAAKLYRNRAASELSALDVHPGQDALLKVLSEIDGQTMGAIAEALNVRPPTVTKMISRLGAQGFVRRESADRDARLARVYLTEEGRARAEGIADAWKRLERIALVGMTDKDRKKLRKLLKQVETNLGATGEPEETPPLAAEEVPGDEGVDTDETFDETV